MQKIEIALKKLDRSSINERMADTLKRGDAAKTDAHGEAKQG